MSARGLLIRVNRGLREAGVKDMAATDVDTDKMYPSTVRVYADPRYYFPVRDALVATPGIRICLDKHGMFRITEADGLDHSPPAFSKDSNIRLIGSDVLDTLVRIARGWDDLGDPSLALSKGEQRRIAIAEAVLR